MKHRTIILLAAAVTLCLASVAPAQAPPVMNYQGRLTDSLGAPVANGSHTVLFKIYGEGDIAVWTESHSVQTSSGLFSVVLGSNGFPLSPGFFLGDEVYLGISVDGDPELIPRVRLTSVPYAFHSGGGGGDDGDWNIIGDDLESAVDGMVGIGTIPSESKLDVLNEGDSESNSYAIQAVAAGSADYTHAVQAYAEGSGIQNIGLLGQADGPATTNYGVVGRAENGETNWAGYFIGDVGAFGGFGDAPFVLLDTTIVGSGQLTTFGPTGSSNVQLWSQPGFPDHGRLDVLDGSDGIKVYMMITNLGDGRLGVLGAAGSINHVLTSRANNADRGYIGVCDENSLIRSALLIDNDGFGEVSANRLTIDGDGGGGDNWVMLPNSSVNSSEMLDETGIAQGRVADAVYVTGYSVMIDIVTVSITTPGPGYVVLEASAQAGLSGTTSGNYMSVQIDKYPLGSNAAGYYQNVGWGVSAPTTNPAYLPVSVRRTYYESSAGTYTYRFEARDGTLNGSKYLWNSVITATYHPTSYGSVATVVSGAEADEFQKARAARSGDNGDGIESEGTQYVVDLRELELRAARAREVMFSAERAALEAERELLQAQLQVANDEAARR